MEHALNSDRSRVPKRHDERRGGQSPDGRMVRVCLSDDRYAWLCDAAAEHKPPLSADELLRQLVDQAIAEGKAAVLRRAEQARDLPRERLRRASSRLPRFPRRTP